MLRCLVVYLHLHCSKICSPQIPQHLLLHHNLPNSGKNASPRKRAYIIQIHSDILNFLLSVHQEGRQSIHISDRASNTHREHAQNKSKKGASAKAELSIFESNRISFFFVRLCWDLFFRRDKKQKYWIEDSYTEVESRKAALSYVTNCLQPNVSNWRLPNMVIHTLREESLAIDKTLPDWETCLTSQVLNCYVYQEIDFECNPS